MTKLSILLTLLRLPNLISGAVLDASALTCFVCTSIEYKDCGDPMLPEKEDTIPYFECKRLFGVFDEVAAKYVQFRPTRHGYVGVQPAADNENERKIEDGTTMKMEEEAIYIDMNANSLADQKETQRSPAKRQMCNSIADWIDPWSSPPCSPPKPVLFSQFDIGSVFHNLFSKGNKKERNIDDDGTAPVFSPYQTQGGPKGLDEIPQHYCYKLIIIDEKHGEIIERGCTNVTTKIQACKNFYKQSNVSNCKYCGLNFCNGIKGSISLEYSGILRFCMLILFVVTESVTI